MTEIFCTLHVEKKKERGLTLRIEERRRIEVSGTEDFRCKKRRGEEKSDVRERE